MSAYDGYSKLMREIEAGGRNNIGRSGNQNAKNTTNFFPVDVRPVEAIFHNSPEAHSYVMQATTRALSDGIRYKIEGEEQEHDFDPGVERKILSIMERVPFHGITKGMIAIHEVNHPMDEEERGSKRMRGEGALFPVLERLKKVTGDSVQPEEKTNGVQSYLVVMETNAGDFMLRTNPRSGAAEAGFRLFQNVGSSLGGGTTTGGHRDVTHVTAGAETSQGISKNVRVFVWSEYSPNPRLENPLRSRFAPLLPTFRMVTQLREFYLTSSALLCNPMVLYQTQPSTRHSLTQSEGSGDDASHLFEMAVRAAQTNMSIKSASDFEAAGRTVQMQSEITNAMLQMGLSSRSVTRTTDELGNVIERVLDPLLATNMRPLPPGHTTATYPMPQVPRDLTAIEQRLIDEVRVALSISTGRFVSPSGRGGSGDASNPGIDSERINRLSLELRDMMRPFFEFLVENYGEMLFRKQVKSHRNERRAEISSFMGSVEDVIAHMKAEGTLEEEADVAMELAEREQLRRTEHYAMISERAEAFIKDARLKYGIELSSANVYRVLSEAREAMEQNSSVPVHPFKGRHVELVFRSQIVPSLSILSEMSESGNIRGDEVARMKLEQLGIPSSQIKGMIIRDEDRLDMQAQAAAKVTDIKDKDREEKKRKREAEGGGGGSSISSSSSKPKEKREEKKEEKREEKKEENKDGKKAVKK